MHLIQIKIRSHLLKNTNMSYKYALTCYRYISIITKNIQIIQKYKKIQMLSVRSSSREPLPFPK